MRFIETENQRLAAFKANPSNFTETARAEGFYKGKPYPFCLPREHAEENLYREIREPAMTYFGKQEIKWHDGQDGKPSNHLRDGQVCCVNFLFPFADKPLALAELLRPLFPTIRQMLPMELPGQFVSFEWIGAANYLGEKVRFGAQRTRGAYFTSADAAVMFEREDRSKQIVLIEWKYTESYASTDKSVGRSGAIRMGIYKPFYDRQDCPLDRSLLPHLADLFYEPFYQLMRQQFLAHEMEQAHELGADVVSVLHIDPAANTDFRRVTSPGLRSLGPSVMDVWKQLVRTPNRFTSVSTEELFGHLPISQLPELAAWWQYINQGEYPLTVGKIKGYTIRHLLQEVA